jgi:M6 family metalloprotease-like protein
MSNLVQLAQNFKKPVALRVMTAADKVIVAQRNGRYFSVDIATGVSSPIFKIITKINSFDITDDGDTLYMVGPAIGLWKERISGGRARRLLRNPINPTNVLILNDQTILATEDSAAGRLFALNEQARTLDVLSSDLNQAVAVLKQESTGRIFVAENSNEGRILEVISGGAPVVLFDNLGSIADVCWANGQQRQLFIADKSGERILTADIEQPAITPTEIFTGIAELWAVQAIDDERIAIGCKSEILIGELKSDPVTIKVPDEELFISGWVRVPVRINKPTIHFDDLEFLVDPKESGAMISYSRDNSFDSSKPHIMLTAGWMTGPHKLVVVYQGNTIASTTFGVLDNWTKTEYGPPVSTFGNVESGPSGGTWGGPDSGDFQVPQNVNVIPALGTRNVGLVLVDTASGRYPTGAALTTIINDFQNEMVNGVGAQNRSVSRYFNEASGGLFNMNLVGITGPIMLPNNWESYFTLGDTWVANGGLDSTIISLIVQQNIAAQQAGNPPVLDLSQIDSLIYVVRSVPQPAPDPDFSVWPRASLSTTQQLVGIDFSVGVPVPQYRGVARVFMPDDWAVRDGARQFHETVAHELGHNLGLNDQYDQSSFSADASSRIAGFNPNQSWELMTWERDLPLPSAAHRLMLGWLNPNQIRMYNFGVFGAIDENITLHATMAGPVPAGRFSAAEVRLEDGKNYYFEYRPSVAGVTADSNPPKASAVLGTEVIFRATNPSDRPNILRVEEDVDAVTDEGSFSITQDFRDRDTTTPGFEQDFIVDVTNTTANAATIRVRYAADLKPDPALTPWSPGSNWQSPDIEVLNGRNGSDPAFRNIPWEGHDNSVVARVTNRGSSDAHSVTVRFFAKDFTFGGGAESPLGQQTLDVPAGATVTFTAPDVWRPTTISIPFGTIQYNQHACLVARMDPFLDPVSNIWEVTPENNEAQSNYTWMASTTSSPASREATVLVAENTLKHPAIVYFTIHQPHPLFRVYLDHRWVFLQPGEKKQILVMTESLLGDARFAELIKNNLRRQRRIATNLRLSALGDTGSSCAAEIIGGASLLVLTGMGTHFERFEAEHGIAFGKIVRNDNGEGQGVNGKVIVSIKEKDPKGRRSETIRETTVSNGIFRVQIGDQQDVTVQGHYLGQQLLAPCESKEVQL